MALSIDFDTDRKVPSSFSYFRTDTKDIDNTIQ